MDWKQELLKRLDALASKLGTTAEYLWHVLVKQAIADGVFNCFLALFFVVSTIVGVHYIKKLHAFNERQEWDHEGAMAGEIITIIATIIVFGLTFPATYWGFMGLFNPEYQALHEVLQTLGK